MREGFPSDGPLSGAPPVYLLRASTRVDPYIVRKLRGVDVGGRWTSSPPQTEVGFAREALVTGTAFRGRGSEPVGLGRLRTSTSCWNIS